MPSCIRLWLMQWLQLMLLLTASSQLAFVSTEELAELNFEHIEQIDGQVVAYVDFNADGWLDLISVHNSSNVNKGSNQQEIRLHLLLQEASTMTPSVGSTSTLINSAELSGNIEAVSVSDFNGDALPDLLISTADATENRVKLWIAYGQSNRRTVGNVAMVTEALDQPTLLDFNADLVTDFLVEVAPRVHVVFCGKFMEYGFTNLTGAFPGLSPLSIPNANLFVDLNGDLRSDLLLRLSIDNDTHQKFVLLTPATQGGGGFVRQTGLLAFPLLQKFLLAKNLVATGNNESVGQPGATMTGPPEPMSADSHPGIDLALPVCQQELLTAAADQLWRCSNASSALWIFSSGAGVWCRASVDGLGSSYAFHPELPSARQSLLRIRASDVDLDGRRDLVCLLRRLSDGAILPGLLRSVSGTDDAPSPADCASGASFQFEAEALPLPDACQSGWTLSGVAPAEMDSDGSPDFLTLCRQESDGRVASRLFAQVHSQPGNFFRIQTLNSARCTGRSPQSCPHGRLPQGLPAPGPCVRLAVDRPSGGRRDEIACQLGQSSAHGRLPLPEAHFGLGQYSNYIEEVTVGVPDNADDGVAADNSRPRRQQEFGFIMPNSLLLVAPHPPDQPSKWLTWLIVRPFSHPHIWGVGLAFLLASGLAFGIAGVLQFLEYRKDKAERAAASPAGFMFDPHPH